MSENRPSTKEFYPHITRVPHHVGIVMDGNGRWAQARGLPRIAGHKAGTENIRRVLRAATDFGIQVLTVYAFSTENWARPAEEVRGLMRLLAQTTGWLSPCAMQRISTYSDQPAGRAAPRGVRPT